MNVKNYFSRTISICDHQAQKYQFFNFFQNCEIFFSTLEFSACITLYMAHFFVISSVEK